ncbi:MAG: hypothetical protein KJN95_13160 [Gammaproteobacteria bacterium]|nr:hypothetical protein [Gammaproteobacteria bacterium]
MKIAANERVKGIRIDVFSEFMDSNGNKQLCHSEGCIRSWTANGSDPADESAIAPAA